jgi:hypothetical protein
VLLALVVQVLLAVQVAWVGQECVECLALLALRTIFVRCSFLFLFIKGEIIYSIH